MCKVWVQFLVRDFFLERERLKWKFRNFLVCTFLINYRTADKKGRAFSLKSCGQRKNVITDMGIYGSRLNICGLKVAGLLKNLQLQGLHVEKQHYFKKLQIFSCVSATSSCRAAIADMKKICACPPTSVFTFSKFLIGWMCSSSKCPVVAAKVLSMCLVSHLLFSTGNRRNPLL